VEKDNRVHPRLYEQDAVAVTVLSAPGAVELENRTFYCSTNDVSVSGLNFSVHSLVPVTSRLKLQVELTEPLATFRHVGRVVWARHIDHDVVLSYRIGVEISETLDNRSSDWAATIRHRIGN
jgi:hypothetical protein